MGRRHRPKRRQRKDVSTPVIVFEMLGEGRDDEGEKHKNGGDDSFGCVA